MALHQRHQPAAERPVPCSGRRSDADGIDEALALADLDTQLAEQGFAHVQGLITPAQCREMTALYAADDLFRSHIVMARHGFGRGEYKHFRYPLPEPIARLREAFYPVLAAVANHWQRQLGGDLHYPPSLAQFLQRCHAAGQTRPTPLLLRYEPGDFNCLHQDVYGAMLFPLQAAILLSQPTDDFTGGEFVLTEQRPRQQSRATVVPLRQGDAVVFPVRERPVEGTRGVYRAQLRHGVSRLLQGSRYTLGLIFHDAT